MADEEKKKDEKSKQEHGENWVTHLYDKVDMPVQMIDKIIIGLVIFIFAMLFIFSKK